jgi:hypothetical protein
MVPEGLYGRDGWIVRHVSELRRLSCVASRGLRFNLPDSECKTHSGQPTGSRRYMDSSYLDSNEKRFQKVPFFSM